jgi:5-formyltetrahydrofolate cyclo-ligase
MAPTYFRREPGIERSDGRRGSALFHHNAARFNVCGRHPEAAKRPSKGDGPGRHPSRLAELVIGPATSGRTRWLASLDDGSNVDAIAQEKSELRRAVQARRDALPADWRKAAAAAIAAREFPLAIVPGTIVSGFMPLKSEINPLPLMRKLADAGARLALPAVAGRGQPLIMRGWQWGEPLAAGVWGIREPMPEAPQVEPEILLVPLLAFDRSGHRIGYGAGYYDLTIAQLRAKKQIAAVGLAFAVQELSRVPTTAFDAPLDLVLTEKDTIDLRNA